MLTFAVQTYVVQKHLAIKLQVLSDNLVEVEGPAESTHQPVYSHSGYPPTGSQYPPQQGYYYAASPAITTGAAAPQSQQGQQSQMHQFEQPIGMLS